METVVVHTKYIPPSPMGIITVDKSKMSDYDMAEFKKAFIETMGSQPLVILRHDESDVKLIPLNKKDGNPPRATFTGIIVEEDGKKQVHIGVSVCSELDQFVRTTGVMRSLDRAMVNPIIIDLVDEGITMRQAAYTVVRKAANGFYHGVNYWKVAAYRQAHGEDMSMYVETNGIYIQHIDAA